MLGSLARGSAALARTVAAAPLRATAGALDAVHGVVAELVPGGRRTWSYGGRLHVELRHAHLPGAEKRAGALVDAVEGHPAVEWARVNAPLGRLIVAVREGPPDEAAGELLRCVEAIDVPPEEPEEDEAGGRELPPGLTLGADLLGLAMTGVEWAARRAPLPAEAAALLGFVDAVPRLHSAVVRAVPGGFAERWMPVAEAAVQALAPGGTGLTLDVAQRAWQWRERAAAGRLWAGAEEELTGRPERAAAPPVRMERPCPL
ncbi:hypothetical protein, partial [Spirillospora sp. NPDC029432]|uniref:hypothetical protein n=1 Tax=Spirillospora sp. NPDC029432 TaxID=3154599 RepID=UPI003452518C